MSSHYAEQDEIRSLLANRVLHFTERRMDHIFQQCKVPIMDLLNNALRDRPIDVSALERLIKAVFGFE